jgi:hypothetical protein
MALACACTSAPPVPTSPESRTTASSTRASHAPLTRAPTATDARIEASPTSPEVAELPTEVRWRERSKICPSGQGLDESQNRALDYFNESPLSVVRVSPNDRLHLRRSSSPEAESLAVLDFQQAGIHWTGSACNVHGSLWFEVEWHEFRGWVNGLYAQPTSTPRDETERVKSWFGSSTKAFAPFVEQLRHAVSQNEVPAELGVSLGCAVKTVGAERDGSHARIVLFIDCRANDSTAGSQLLVTATQDPAGWRVARVEWRDVCVRGAAELCI